MWWKTIPPHVDLRKYPEYIICDYTYDRVCWKFHRSYGQKVTECFEFMIQLLLELVNGKSGRIQLMTSEFSTSTLISCQIVYAQVRRGRNEI